MMKHNRRNGWNRLKAFVSSLLLMMMVLTTSLFTGCGIVEIVPDSEETQGLTISEVESGSSEDVLESLLSESETDYLTSESESEAVGQEQAEAVVPVETIAAESETGSGSSGQGQSGIDRNGSYTSKDEVALYLHIYGELPSNFITKQEAEDLGWNSSKGNLWKVADGKSIGGSYFGNYEEKLPKKKGRKYYECDINYDGGYRGAERIIYSNDGLIFYTEDHYESFEQLY